jgi:hypothetical protein
LAAILDGTMMALRAARCNASGRLGRRLAVLATMSLAVLLLAACSAASGPTGSVASEGPLVSDRPPAPDGSPSLELASPQPSKALPGGGAIHTGTLGSDTIEGGCTYLETADGRKLEVIYPDGWTVRRAPLELVDPSGQVVARAGDRVTIRGEEADMMSICQIGPIIRATEVRAG